MIVIDFETYFDPLYSLKKLSIAEYIGDRRFKVHGIAVGLPDGRNVFRVDVDVAIAELQRSFGSRLEKAMVVMHNAYFDGAVLSWKYGITPTNIVDTMLLSHHVYGPRADGGARASVSALASRLGLQQKGRIDFLSGVAQPNRTQLADLAQYAVNDVDLERKIAVRLLPMISSRRTELPIMAHCVRLFTEKSLRLDVIRVNEARHLITNQVVSALAGAAISDDQAYRDGPFAELLTTALKATVRVLPVKQGKHRQIPAIAKDDEAMQALRADADPYVRALVMARLTKKSADQMLSRLNTMQSMANARGGRLAPQLMYHGTHTGRFSSNGGLNMQNMPSPNRQRTPETRAVAVAVRRCITADPGHKLVCVDASQIEMPDQPSRLSMARAALLLASMRREVTNLPTLFLLARDPALPSLTRLSAAQQGNLVTYCAASANAYGRAYDALQSWTRKLGRNPAVAGDEMPTMRCRRCLGCTAACRRSTSSRCLDWATSVAMPAPKRDSGSRRTKVMTSICRS